MKRNLSYLLKREEDLKTSPEINYAYIIRSARQLQNLDKRQSNSRISHNSREFVDRKLDYSKKFSEMSIEEKKKVSRCSKCGHKGHWYRECKTKPENYQRQFIKASTNTNINMTNSESEPSTFMVATDLDKQMKHFWLVDSGATQHMCCQRDWFDELTLYSEPDKCHVGGGGYIEILGKGRIKLICKRKMTTSVNELKDVLFIPDLAANLISTGRAADNGIESHFGKSQCLLTNNNKLVAMGDRIGEGSGKGLYLMRVAAVKHENPVAMFCQAERTLSEWHQALGHPSIQRIERLIKDQELGLRIIDKRPEEGCSSCPAGGAKHSKHPTRDNMKATRVGERVHIDLSGPIIKSFGGSSYYLLCKDEYSSFCLSYFARSKADVHLKLAKLINDFEVASGNRIERFMSDCGTEFINQTTELLLAKEKISHETSAPRTPQQNGRVERGIGIITSKARTMLQSTRLPKELWTEAVQTACYLHNRLPNSTTNDKTPYEMFFGRKPQLKHVVEFGKECHVITNSQYLTKFDARTEEAYVVGFTERSNTYRCYLPESKRVIPTSDVTFKPHNKQVFSRLDSTKVKAKNVKVTIADKPIDNIQEKPSKERVVDAISPIQQSVQQTNETVNDQQQQHELVDIEKSTEVISEMNENVEAEHHTIEENAPVADEEEANELTEQVTEDFVDALEESINDLVMTFFVNLDRDECPQNYKEAINNKYKTQWLEAIREELMAHKKNGTWISVKKPPGKRLLSTRWLFTIKRNNDNSIERYKARLVARGYEQVKGIDYFETFAPVARKESLRLLIAIAAQFELQIAQFDVRTAFLYGELQEEVYIEAPEGYTIREGEALKLVKGLYGLKQAPRVWNNKFRETIDKFGFKPIRNDTCVFVNAVKRMFMCLYVDDGLLFARKQSHLDQTLEFLQKEFDMRVIKSNKFIGIEIEKIIGGYVLNQQAYATKILERFDMNGSCVVSTPLKTNHNLTDKLDADEGIYNCPYREAVGALLYLATFTRPDILFAVNLLSKYNSCPQEKHWSAVQRLFRYLKGTISHGIRFEKSPQFSVTAYSDADFANDLSERKSISGCIIFLANGPVIFRSVPQSIVASSTTESEYIAASVCAKEVLWVNHTLRELRVDVLHTVMKLDSQPALKLIKNPEVHRRTKHIDVKYHLVRDYYTKGEFKLEYVDTSNQLADYLTKALARTQFETLIYKSNVREGKPM